MDNKIEKIVELGIDIDNMSEEELFEDLGVDVISFVESPAIEHSFLYFNEEGTPTCDCGEPHEFEECVECFDDLEDACKPGYKAIGLKPKGGRMVPNCVPVEAAEEEFETYSDYPKAAMENAQRAINYAEENGWGSCGTNVGKQRAHQLAKGENISRETIARMAAFERHRQNSGTPYGEGCGKLMWDAWGGDEGIAWAQRKLEQIDAEMAKKKKKKKYTYDETVDMLLAYAEENGEYTTHEDIEVNLSEQGFNTVGSVLEGLGALDLLTRLDIKRDAPAETFYRYVGPPAQRKFCKAMLRLANRGKIFSQPQIEAMSGLNPDFARKNESQYSVFQWVGGKNCKHHWQKLNVFKNAEGKRVIIVSDPQTDAQRNASLPWAQKMSEHAFSLDEDKRLVYSPVMIPNKMILRRDEEGNPFYVYFSAATIKKMAEKFLAQSKMHNTDVEHDGNVSTQNTLIESWVSEDMTHDKSYKLGFALPKGTWYVGYRINDDELWSDIKEGRLRGVSLAGNFINRL